MNGQFEQHLTDVMRRHDREAPTTVEWPAFDDTVLEDTRPPNRWRRPALAALAAATVLAGAAIIRVVNSTDGPASTDAPMPASSAVGSSASNFSKPLTTSVSQTSVTSAASTDVWSRTTTAKLNSTQILDPGKLCGHRWDAVPLGTGQAITISIVGKGPSPTARVVNNSDQQVTAYRPVALWISDGIVRRMTIGLDQVSVRQNEDSVVLVSR